MAESDISFEELFSRPNNTKSEDVLVTIFRRNTDLDKPPLGRYLGGGCWEMRADNFDDDYMGVISLHEMISGGLALTLYAGTLTELMDKNNDFTPTILLELMTRTKTAQLTGTDGIETAFRRPLVIPSKQTDWALKIARQCSTLASEHLESVFKEN